MRPGASIANMMSRLAVLEHDRGDENLAAVIDAGVEESNRALEAEVLRSSARQLAESIVQDLATKRIRDLAEMLASEIRERLDEFLEEARTSEVTATGEVLIAEAETLAARTEAILSHWMNSGEEPSEEDVDRIVGVDGEELDQEGELNEDDE